MNPINQMINEMFVSPLTKTEERLDAVLEALEDKCDYCGAKLEENDYKLGTEFDNGEKMCQKCWDQSQDYLED